MTITIRTTLPAFKAQLDAMKADFQSRAVKSAARAAGGVMRDQARGLAPVLARATAQREPGVLRKNVYTAVPRRQPAGMIRAVVTVRSGRRSQRGARDPFYWRYLEGGWRPRGPGRGLKGGKRSKALQRKRATASLIRHPFLLPAFSSSGGAALAAFYARLAEAIQKYQAMR